MKLRSEVLLLFSFLPPPTLRLPDECFFLMVVFSKENLENYTLEVTLNIVPNLFNFLVQNMIV